MDKKNYLKPLIIIVLGIFVIYSFFINFLVNLGGLLIILFVIGCFIYRLGEDSKERKLESFKTWVGINLDERKERLSDIEDKLDEIEDDEYDISQDNATPHSKNELNHKLKEEKKLIENRIKKLEKAYLDAEEEIPE